MVTPWLGGDRSSGRLRTLPLRILQSSSVEEGWVAGRYQEVRFTGIRAQTRLLRPGGREQLRTVRTQTLSIEGVPDLAPGTHRRSQSYRPINESQSHATRADLGSDHRRSRRDQNLAVPFLDDEEEEKLALPL